MSYFILTAQNNVTSPHGHLVGNNLKKGFSVKVVDGTTGNAPAPNLVVGALLLAGFSK